MHAAIRIVEQRSRVLGPLYAADDGGWIVIVADDDVRVAPGRILHADQVERQRAGNLAVAAVHENGADFAARLQELHGLAHGRGIAVGGVKVVAAAVDGDDESAGRQARRNLVGADVVFLAFLAAQLAVEIRLDRINRRAVRLDAERYRQIGASDPVEDREARAVHEIGEANEAGNRVAAGIDGSYCAVLDCAQRKQLARSGHVAVAMVRHHDDVGRGLLAELLQPGPQLAEHGVGGAQGIARIGAADAIDVLRSIGIADPEHAQPRRFLRQDVIDVDVGHVLKAGLVRAAGTVGGVEGHAVLQALGRLELDRVAVVRRQRKLVLIGFRHRGRQRNAGRLQLLGKAQRQRRLLIEQQATSLVVLDEGGSRLADGRGDHAGLLGGFE